MSGIDDLAHDAEVEAEVLRAVAHMAPARAQEFLIGLVLKIKRAHSPATPGSVTLPRLLASSTIKPAESAPVPIGTVREFGTRTAQIIECVRRLGQATTTDVCNALELHGNDRACASATLCSLKRRGFLRKEGGHFSLATLESDLAAVGE